MYAAEHAHFTAELSIRHLLQRTILGYCSLVFFRYRAPTASSANTLPSLVCARSSSTRFTGPSSVSCAPTTSSANTTTSPSRNRSAAAHPSTTTSCVSSHFLQTLHHPVPRSTYGVSTAHLRGAPPTDRRVCNATRQEYLQPGYYRVESHLPFFLVASPPNHVS